MTNPFSYQPARNPLSRAGAVPKMFLMVCVSVASMNFSPLPLLILIAAGLLIHRLAGIPLGAMIKPSVFILYLGIFSALVRGLFPGGGRLFALETLGDSGLYTLRLFSAFLCARLYYTSTRASELGDSLSVFARRMFPNLRIPPDHGQELTLNPGRKAPYSGILADPGMILSLSLLFLPKTFETLGRVKEAAVLRGYGKGKTLPKTMAMIGTLVSVSVKSALTTAKAMEARGYSARRTITRRKTTAGDYALCAAGFLILILSALPGI